MDWARNTSTKEYMAQVLDAVRAGNFEVRWAPVTIDMGGHHAEFRVFADALKIDGVRINVSAYLEQQIADLLSCSLLTPRLADLIWYQRTMTLPMFYDDAAVRGGTMGLSPAMLRHSENIDKAILDARGRGESDRLLCTVGKHWVLDNGNMQHTSRATNYGWQDVRGNLKCVDPVALPDPNPHVSPTCKLFQDPGWAHDNLHSDYSQTCVLVARRCVVDGAVMDIRSVMTTKELAPLVSHQGPLQLVRALGVPELPAIYAPEVASASSSPFRRAGYEQPGEQPSGDVGEDRGVDWGAIAATGLTLAAVVGGFWWGLRAMGSAASRARASENPARTRAEIAAVANRAGLASRRPGAPILSPSSSRATLVRWLQWNDPNGAHLDEYARQEGFDPYTLESAWEALAEMVKENPIPRTYKGAGVPITVRQDDRGRWWALNKQGTGWASFAVGPFPYLQDLLRHFNASVVAWGTDKYGVYLSAKSAA